MLTGIDHIVIAVHDLDEAMANYRELGFHVIVGGEHPTGSHNALISFADGAYIELIAWREPSPDVRWYRLLQNGGGLIDYCMRTDDLDGDLHAFRDGGVTQTERRDGGRARPDGYHIKWVTGRILEPLQGVAPFIIEDVTPRDERVPSETTQPNGVTGIDNLVIAVPETKTLQTWYRRVLNNEGEAITNDALKGRGLRYNIGPHTIDYLAPTDDTSPLKASLDARGPTPFAAAFKTSGDTTGVLDKAKTLGARLTLTTS
ncbi:MAG: hypothetical protein D6737_19920 [Chloroflexi bacterium]|nr:MAG: hypothetical protein D6737_19920 [Chloroflexota bacterium]